MPLLNNVLRRVRRSGPNPATMDEGAYWHTLPRSLSGISVTDDAALGLTAVYRAVNLIATTVGSLPIHVYQERDDGSSKKIKPITARYLWDRPNPEMTRQTFWETVVGHEVLGDAFLFVAKATDGFPLQLWYIEPWRVRVGRYNGRKVYEVDHELAMIDYVDGGEIIHVPNWGRDPLRGINPIHVAAEAIALGIAAEQYAERYFSNDATHRGLLTSDQVLDPDDAKAISERWAANWGGMSNAGKIPVLGGGAKYQTVSNSPADSQLLEVRKFQKSEIATLFGIPPHLLGDVERSTSWGTGIAEQTQGFLVFALHPHINRFKQAIDDALLRKGETNQYMLFEPGGLLRMKLTERYQAYALGYGRWLTPNDIRRLEDMEPVEGGDDLLAAVNLIPIEQLGTQEDETAPIEVEVPAPSRNGNGSRA